MKRDEWPDFNDLMSYAARMLEGMLHKTNAKFCVFCEMNNIDIAHVEFFDNRFRLALSINRSVKELEPLGTKELLWLEKFVAAELALEDLDPDPQGGGYIYYTIKQVPNYRWDEIGPDFKERHWAGGEWRS